MNDRWQRNLEMINSIERKKETIKQKLKNKELTTGELEELELELIDCDNEIQGLQRSFKELIQEAKDDIKTMYLNEDDEGEWTLAWSGGKDSTTVAGLMIDVLNELPPEKRTRKIHFVMSDTMVENPNLEIYMRGQIDKLKKYVSETGLPITVRLVHRPIEKGYFYLILGRGYFLPRNNGSGRWCTDRLKIQPQKEALMEIKPTVQLTGVRLSESARRKASIQKHTLDSRANKKLAGGSVGLITFMPIVDFTIEDVWEYLQRERLAWTSTHEVRTLYKEATGECGFTNPKKTEEKASLSESCGARFGCWTCPVILKDKSTEAMSEYNEWMKPLSNFRMLQIKVMGDYICNKPEGQKRKARSYVIKECKRIGAEIKLITKSGHMRNGKKFYDADGNLVTNKGTITVETRKFLFDKLMETQDEVNRLRKKVGLAEIQLISNEEIELIHKMWEHDYENAEWLVTNSNGISFENLYPLLEELERLENNQPIDI